MTPAPGADPPSGAGAPPTDEQRTIVEQRTVVEAPPLSGGAALPVGVALQEFVIEGLVGEGGFGIVYLARDTRLDRQVALKEYMPTNLAQRSADRTVSVRSERYRETFDLGLRSFVNEAKLLASFDHPSLVKVYRFWQENGTAYMVMPFYQGPTLRQKLAELGEPPDEAWLRALLAPLIDALELIHNDHCWHRDIAPDNILLLAPQKTQAGTGPQLRPLLLDFGAARRVIGDVTHNLTVILKPGYAPIEQYAESQSMKQGAWTDVYALCAVLYCAVTGRAPVPSVSRVLSDDMQSAAQAGAGRYSQSFLEAIDAGLAVRPDARPQSMAALRERFDIARAASGAAAQRSAVRDEREPVRTGAAALANGTTDAAEVAAPSSHNAPQARGAASEGVDSRDVRGARDRARNAGGTGSAGRSGSAATANDFLGAAGAKRWPLIVAGFIVLVVAAAVFGWWLQRSTAPQRSQQPSPPQAPQLAQPETPKIAPETGSQTAQQPAPQIAPQTTPQPAPQSAPQLAQPSAPASTLPSAATTAPVDAASPGVATPAAAASPAPVTAAPPPVAAATKTNPAARAATASRTPAATPAPPIAARPPEVRTPVSAAPARTPPPAIVAEPAPAAAPSVAAQPAQPALDPKRFECEVLVRAGQKALANRSYDDAMQRAEEAQAVYPDCAGAAELGRAARQAKDRARSSVVIQ